MFVHGATAWLDCRLHSELPAGDHTIALLEISGLSADPGTPPLVFHGSRFHRLAMAGGVPCRCGRMRTADIRVRRAIAAVAQAARSLSRRRAATGIPGLRRRGRDAQIARLHRPAYLGLRSRALPGSECGRLEPTADVSRRATGRLPSGGSRLVWRRHRHFGDRSRQHHRGARCGIFVGHSDFRRPGHVVPVPPATTGCWGCRHPPRPPWTSPGLRAVDPQECCARSSLASRLARSPTAPGRSSSPTGTD